jgi:hypothetical protein
MSKFLLNLLLQIFQALEIQKSNFYLKRFIPPILAHSAQPAYPLPQPWPAGRPKPSRPELPAHAASQPPRLRTPLAYFAEAIFLFGSRLPEPAASPAFL